MAPRQLERQEFLDEYWDYRAGEHVSLIYPTQRGKSHLAYQLLGAAMRDNPRLQVVSLMPKPNSPSTHAWAKALNLRETPVWPPQRKLLEAKPAGHVLWPLHRKDLPVDQNRAQVGAMMRKALGAQYWKGNTIMFADDVFILGALMKLNPDLEEWWTAGGEGGAGLWCANQKPSGSLSTGSVSSFSYNAPSHLFLGRDTDQRNIQRFSEIGGIDPREVEGIVRNLKLYRIGEKTISEVLYIDKRIPAKALIGP